MDAPISGGMVGVDVGTITFMIGGDEADFEAVKPLTDAMGSHAVYCGGNGAGLTAKICNKMLLSINQIGAAETFDLGTKLDGVFWRTAARVVSHVWTAPFAQEGF
jgi:3-hydroxyisobutyrate dehydrogenase